MSDALYPGDLPGLKWDRKRAPSFKTSIYEALSGAERRLRHRQWPKYSVDLTYEVLRESRQIGELQKILGFFLQQGGSFESFLFKDPHDSVASNLIFGQGDGVTRHFQLLRRIGDFAEPVHNPSADSAPGRVWFPYDVESFFWPQYYGWPTAGDVAPLPGSYTLLPGGIVEFAVAPAAGAVLAWSGTYYFRARFGSDRLEYNEFMRRLYSTGTINLVASLQNIL
ncbi:DUF2460 domain-containing protein [Variovorax ginsengisoli]|uniref:DUF2460 domain-containing protein n=1 Tax=Variovorax ginsengisoli TaxID=363844 RepID=A0ABT9SE15_9BURK|nr:DUF2460 domain-containing protein [Variovorax ginsengisoli]MDP9902610.1 hypothetical protein [Variovorax ginsengisoli]